MGLDQNAIDAPREQKRMETSKECAEGDTVQTAALYKRGRATSADLRQRDADEIQRTQVCVLPSGEPCRSARHLQTPERSCLLGIENPVHHNDRVKNERANCDTADNHYCAPTGYNLAAVLRGSVSRRCDSRWSSTSFHGGVLSQRSE
jgi:putative hemolysin